VYIATRNLSSLSACNAYPHRQHIQ